MPSKILKKEFEALRVDLIKAYDEKGMRASSNFADSLDIIIGDTYAELWGDKYAEQLEHGRKSGSFPPLVDIENWILQKGIFSAALEQMKLSSLAFLIARKIARDGWKRARHGGVGLISEVITEERLQKIINKFGDAEVIKFSTDITNIFKELSYGD